MDALYCFLRLIKKGKIEEKKAEHKVPLFLYISTKII